MVADGMGAHAAGELASKQAVERVPDLYIKYAHLSPPEALEQAIAETNAEVHRRGQANPEFHNMGTTASILVLLPQGALVGHIGDSRVYRQRGEKLEQLTFDHSLVWELRAAGQLNEKGDLAHAVPKNVITRSLGPYEQVQIDIEGPFPIQTGDIFLLCSDGLTGEVDDDELGPILSNLSPQDSARVLIDLANLRGGPDNITVLVAKVTDDGWISHSPTFEPIVIGGKAKEGTVHPALWIVSGVCGLLAAVMALAAQPVPAAIALLVSVVTLLVALWQRYGGERKGVALGEGRRLGKGPHTETSCLAQNEFVERLAATVRDLRNAAKEEEWAVQWATLDQLCQDALTASEEGRHCTAVRDYARAISFIMNELRKQNRDKASDSTIDY